MGGQRKSSSFHTNAFHEDDAQFAYEIMGKDEDERNWMVPANKLCGFRGVELQMRCLCRRRSRNAAALRDLLKGCLRRVEEKLHVTAHISAIEEEDRSDGDTYKLFVRLVSESVEEQFDDLLLNFFTLWTGPTEPAGGERGNKDAWFVEFAQEAAYSCRFIACHRWGEIGDLKLGYFLGIGSFCTACSIDQDAYDICCDFEHDLQKIIIFFSSRRHDNGEGGTAVRYKLALFYKALSYLTVDYGRYGVSLYFRIKFPPILYRAKNYHGYFGRFEAIASLPFCKRQLMGSCSVIMMKLRVMNDGEHDTLWDLICRLKRRARVPVYFGPVTMERPTELPDYEMREDLWNFDCHYYWCALKSRGLAVASQMDEDFAKQLLASFAKNPKATEQALFYMLTLIDQLQEIFLLSSFKKYFEKYDSMDLADLEDSESDNSYVRVRKVVITPTRMLLAIPDAMMSNRVVRHFGADWALRAAFRSDDGGRIRAFMYNADDVDDVLRQPLRNGITIGERHYEFLGWSNSQLRDGGCYFYAKTPKGETASDIRKWMGNFDGIGNIPKLMSRMGQCFTQSIKAIEIPHPIGSEEIPIEEDYYSRINGEKKFCFSDGVGQISVKLAAEVAERLQLTPVPSAFQIRFAGCKGMLSVNPCLPEVRKMVVRESMLKFRTDSSNALEIVKTSQPCPVNLNRPLILILDEVSINENEVVRERMRRRINELLNEQLYGLADMLLLESCASRELASSVQLGMDFGRLSKAGVKLTNEVFFRNMMLSIYSSKVKEPLLKLKIDVPPHLGRTMFGILDETAILAPNEVFIQISTDINAPGKSLKIIKGRVMVTKSPCIVPGDVRILNAVDIDSLRHLRDVIVFPKIGFRPVVDQMAGSDLDGDEYSAFWDPDLMFTKNYKPMSFPKPHVPNFEGEITAEAMVDFFITYLCADSVGTIATAHLVASDKHGIFHEIPMGLAKKHSMAVDFPKTGVMPEKLSEEERISTYPDYLSFGYHPTYKSRWLPGPMTRRVRSAIDVIDLSSMRRLEVSVDQDMAHDKWEDFARSAARSYTKYRQVLFSLLSEYGIENEFQLFSGHFTDLKGRLSLRERDDYSLFTTERIVQMRLKGLIANFRKQFAREFGTDYSELASNEKALAKASAWYMVAYRDKEVGKSQTAFSFPWIVWDLLVVIKERRPANLRIPSNPVMDRLEGLISKMSGKGFENLKKRLAAYRITGGYSDAVMDVLCIYVNWCLRGRLIGEGKPEELVRTFLRSFDRFLAHLKMLPQLLSLNVTDDLDEQDEMAISSLPKCQLFIQLFRFLGTRISGSGTNVPPYLAELAFKAYHKAALTGSFASFYLEEPKQVESDAKEMEPITFLPPEKILGTVGPAYMYDRLRKWSGVMDLTYRTTGHGYHVVSAFGSLEARCRLYELLICDDLEAALEYDMPPF